jgi:DNA-binding transcriptional LysR family regulator
MTDSDAFSALGADLDLLVVFAVVAREGSFTRAAQLLGVTQPSVSARVQRLERRLGEPVFRRLGRGVRVTPAGEALREAAERALALAQEAGELVSGVRGLSHGRVRFAASTTIAGYVLPERIARFHALYPEVEVDVAVDNTAAVAARVERREVRWGLVEGPVDVAHFSVRPFMQDELVLIVPAAHPWARRERVEAAELPEAVFLGREEGSGTGAIYEAALADLGIRLRPRVRIGDSRGIAAAVAAGAGVAFVSAFVLRSFV